MRIDRYQLRRVALAFGLGVAGCGDTINGVDAGGTSPDLAASPEMSASDDLAGAGAIDLSAAASDLAWYHPDLSPSRDLAFCGGDSYCGDLALPPGPDLATKPPDCGGGGDGGGGGNTVSGVNCSALGPGGLGGLCAVGTYEYSCAADPPPEMGCVARGGHQFLCCPHKLCVSYPSSDGVCGGTCYPHYYSCQPGLTPSGTCVANGMGINDFCCQ